VRELFFPRKVSKAAGVCLCIFVGNLEVLKFVCDLSIPVYDLDFMHCVKNHVSSLNVTMGVEHKLIMESWMFRVCY
jgi:hypothetical protein